MSIGTTSLIEYTPTQSGTYYLFAGAFGNNGTGTYRVGVIAPTRTVVFPSTRGTIAYEGEQDEFTVSLSAGSRYQIDLEGSATDQGTLSNPYLRILNSSGARLKYDDDSGKGLNSQLVLSPTSSGTYRLQASGYGSSRGSYTLSVSQIG
ncbi:pre-peptidase C-terminal domain-containing protein [Azospirillum agricola]|uniref:pre-peptidase C-terminal domain-containing protein n=1 Tax=Azospirillum agricola TaxID=1720247 RepID=UPI001AE6F932|nr:pre-peptidase C-terminal domain-containing protein [Azospirillum agricola]